MNAKAVKFGKNHTDKYVYDAGSEMWVSVACNLEASMDCTAPNYKRGELPKAYNTQLTAAEEHRAEMRLAQA